MNSRHQQRINSRQDIWLKDYPFINKITLDKLLEINPNVKVTEFIDENTNWKVETLSLYLLEDINGQIINTPIPVTNIEDTFC